MTRAQDGSPFHAAAVRYCAAIDGLLASDRGAFLDRVAVCLSELYHLACQLTSTQSSAEAPTAKGLKDDDARALEGRLESLLGDWALYWDVYDPTEVSPDEPVAGSLADDFADIYRDLHGGLQLWERGQHEDARWEWRFRFWSHWGAHAVAALREIHWRRHFARGNHEQAKPPLRPTGPADG